MFERNMVIAGVPWTDKQEVFSGLAAKAEETGLIEDPGEYVRELWNREAEYSTAMGYGIAIPHAASSTVRRSFVAAARLEEPIDWDSSPVSMVFMIGVPREKRQKDHLRILAGLSRSLMHEEFRNRIASLSEEELYIQLKEMERTEKL